LPIWQAESASLGDPAWWIGPAIDTAALPSWGDVGT